MSIISDSYREPYRLRNFIAAYFVGLASGILLAVLVYVGARW